jgi:hypothetical protein
MESQAFIDGIDDLAVIGENNRVTTLEAKEKRLVEQVSI